MILHILTDDKFADYAIKQFAKPEMNSDFVCFNTAGRINLVELKDAIEIVDPYNEDFISYLDDNLCKYSAIVFHGMHWGSWQSIILKRLSENVKVAWVLWGGDVYGRHDVSITFLAPFTKKIHYLHNIYKKLFKHSKRVVNEWEIEYDLFQRVDYCLTSQDEEYQYAVHYCNKQFKRLWYTYYSLEEMIGPLIGERCSGNNVWLGNSATLTNNHIDILLFLFKNKSKLKNRKIIIPLSYSEKWVANIVAKLSKILFNNQCLILDKMLLRNDYNKLMLNCSTMIMAHYMSQGMGNIYTGLWLGMRVYMSEKNISYKYLQRIGIHVYSIENDFEKYGYMPLSDNIVEHNRKVLLKVYGCEHVMSEIRNVVKEFSV